MSWDKVCKITERSPDRVFIFNKYSRFDGGDDVLPPKISVIRIPVLWCRELVARNFFIEDSSFYRVVVHHDLLEGLIKA